MAVPRRQNGAEEEAEGVYLDEDWSEPELEVPPHLQELSFAVQIGDVDALRSALGMPLKFFYFCDEVRSLDFVWSLLIWPTFFVLCDSFRYSFLRVLSIDK